MPAKTDANSVEGTVDPATDADPIEKVRAASSIAPLQRTNGRKAPVVVIEGRRAVAIGTAKIDIITIIVRRLKNRCRRSQ